MASENPDPAPFHRYKRSTFRNGELMITETIGMTPAEVKALAYKWTDDWGLRHRDSRLAFLELINRWNRQAHHDTSGIIHVYSAE